MIWNGSVMAFVILALLATAGLLFCWYMGSRASSYTEENWVIAFFGCALLSICFAVVALVLSVKAGDLEERRHSIRESYPQYKFSEIEPHEGRAKFVNEAGTACVGDLYRSKITDDWALGEKVCS